MILLGAFVVLNLILAQLNLSVESEVNSSSDGSIINPPECGRRINEIRGERLNKIVGGQQADPEDWGWQVLLEYFGSFSCGGSLINTEWVITAAHCIDSSIPFFYTIRLGLHDRSNPEDYSIVRNVSEIIVHPQYNPGNLHNDIALLKLNSPVDYTDQILPVCLPIPNYDFSEQASWATGWGRMNEDFSLDSISDFLMEMETKILNMSMCEDRYGFLDPPVFNSSVNICAGGDGKSICSGDSGGPIVVKNGEKWELAGISSWGLRNYSAGISCFDGGVFAKTSFYIDWITDNIKKKTTNNIGLSTSKSTSEKKEYECGKRINEIRGERLNKIVGGQQADPEDWGWQVLLEYFGSFLCGGSLINTEWVITAAHCIDSSIPFFYTIRLGLHDRSNPEDYSIVRNVSEIIVHPQYNSANWQNDVALLKLNTPVDYTDQILPICLPAENYDFSNQMAWATGWGSLISGGFTSNNLMEVEIPILSESDCRLKYFQSDNLLINTTNSICAGENGQGKDTCQGDSGGPLVVKVGDSWQLAGITSWGFGCGDGGVYTKTSFFTNWIIEKTSFSSSFFSTSSSISSSVSSSISSSISSSVSSTSSSISSSVSSSVSSTSSSISSSVSSSSSSSKTTDFPLRNLTVFEFSGFFQINDSESSSRLMSDHLRKSTINQNLEPLYEKFRQILGLSTEFRLKETSNDSYDLVIIVTRESETDLNFISTEISTITLKIQEKKQELISTLPSSVKHSFENSKIKSFARQTMIENGVRIITECDQNSASEDISCVKTIVYSNGTIVNGTSFTLTRNTVESQDSNTEPNSNGISSSTSSSLSSSPISSTRSNNTSTNSASIFNINLAIVFLIGSIKSLNFS